MKTLARERPPSFVSAPTDRELLFHWYELGQSTAEIAKHFSYPEYCVDSRLWRLREDRRAKA